MYAGKDDLADSFVRLVPTVIQERMKGRQVRFSVADWFTPYRRLWLDELDMDLGSAGPMLIPNTKYLVGGGKQGLLYLLNRMDMGRYDSSHRWGPAPSQWNAIHENTIASDDAAKEDFRADRVAQKLQAGVQQYIPTESPYLAPPGAPLAVATQQDHQLDVFVVGNDGGIYVTWELSDSV